MKRTTREWVRKAESDFQLAVTIAREAGRFQDEQCFHSQQCAEKYLKALLEELGLTIPRTSMIRLSRFGWKLRRRFRWTSWFAPRRICNGGWTSVNSSRSGWIAGGVRSQSAPYCAPVLAGSCHQGLGSGITGGAAAAGDAFWIPESSGGATCDLLPATWVGDATRAFVPFC